VAGLVVGAALYLTVAGAATAQDDLPALQIAVA
jgi:hypothetical protein